MFSIGLNGKLLVRAVAVSVKAEGSRKNFKNCL